LVISISFPILWGQRGVAISYIISILCILLIKIKLKYILIYICLFILLIFPLISVLGDVRSNVVEEKYIGRIAEIDSELPSGLLWFYAYSTTSLRNFNDTLNRKNIIHTYGSSLISPFYSLFFMKNIYSEVLASIDLKVDSQYEIRNGFNVGTYFYTIYVEFGYFGLLLIPYILGFISQYLFLNIGSPGFTIFYSWWVPCILFSFHGFLFWELPILIILIILFIIILNPFRKSFWM